MDNNRAKLITPFLMLFAGALASVIMYVRHFDLFTMLWVLLLVLVIFYVIGDVARYLYQSVQPKILPDVETLEDYLASNGNIVSKEKGADDAEADEDVEEMQEAELSPDEEDAYMASDGENADDEEAQESEMADASEEEGYTDENLE